MINNSGPRQQVDARMAAAPPASKEVRARFAREKPFCLDWNRIHYVSLRPYLSTEASQMEKTESALTIGTLANASGVTVETIRFYQRRGLMIEPRRPYGGIRRYSDADLGRVRFIKASQRLGFSLDKIASLAPCFDRC